MRVAAITIMGLVVIIAAAAWFEYLEPVTCWSSDRLVSSDQVVAFARNQIREDKNFWLGIGVTDEDEMAGLLAKAYCTVGKGDYFIQDNTRWGAYMSAKSQGRYDFQYEVFFSECGKHVRAEKLITTRFR